MKTLLKVDALALITSRAWQEYAEVLLSRYLDLAQMSIKAPSEQRTEMSKAMGELRFVLEQPYATAERHDSPMKALERLDWFKVWSERAADVSTEEWAAFKAWQASQPEPMIPPASQLEAWERSNARRSSPV